MEDINKKREIEEEKRRRQLAILKASNQLLEETRDKMLEKEHDEVERDRLRTEFAKAINENKFKAQTYLNSTEKDIENAQYREVSQEWIDKYKKRLEKKGITDEELHEKGSAVLEVGKKKEESNSLPRRKRKGKKTENLEFEENDVIVRLDNEEELMKKTLVVSDEQINEHIKENQEKEHKKKNPIDEAIGNIVEITKEQTVKSNDAEEEVKKPIIDTPMPAQAIVNGGRLINVKRKKRKPENNIKYDFDFSSIPSYVQYDVIPLPSNGQCYPIDSPLRCGKIAVSYLTASDENIITSPNLYRDGKVIDMILSRKIIDKRININELCSGDRDAVILWLRATSYGTDFPIVATNPTTGKKYDVSVDLSQFDFLDFFLEGDDDGLFDYTTVNGDLIKFKIFTKEDEDKLRNALTNEVSDVNCVDIVRNIGFIKNSLTNVTLTEEENSNIDEDLEEIIQIISEKMLEFNEEKMYMNAITEQMIMHTVSVNGNTDKEFIKGYIENMRVQDSLGYRNYFNDNKPGVDFTLNVRVPESDGGGSFTTFLRFDDYVFINN